MGRELPGADKALAAERVGSCGVDRVSERPLFILLLRRFRWRGAATDGAVSRDPVLAFVCRAPNDIAWHVMGFWRATTAE